MTNLARKIQEKPPSQEATPRKLYYRPHVKWFYYAFLVVSLIVECVVLLRAGAMAARGRPDAALSAAIAGSILPAILLLEAWVLFRPLVFSFVQVFPDRIELNRIGKIITFKFPEITTVRFSYLPYLGGWFAIVSNGKKPYRFTVVLERSEAILDAIAAASPNLVDQKRLFKYRKTAVYIDHSWARIYCKVKAWPSFLFKYFVFPAVLAGSFLLFSKTQTPKAMVGVLILTFFANFAIGYAFYLVEEVIFGRRLSKTLLSSPSFLKRDMEAELVTQRKVQIVYYCIAIVLSLLVIFRLAR